MNIHDIYLNFLKHENAKNAESRNDGKFHASSAGSCYRKQMYRLEDYPQDDMDDNSYKILRLGTIVHKDFEDAIKHRFENDKYRMQLATYGMAIKEELEVKELNMFLVFYNKNTSMIREVKVYADEWIEKAKDYWDELLMISKTMKDGLFEEKLRPGWQLGVPYEDWECKYCNYKTICPSKLK